MSRATMTRGVFDSTMAYARWGEASQTVLFVPGGPGNTLPEDPLRMVGGRLFRPLVDAAYAVWAVTRPRNLPDGYSIQDMADDYAAVIDAEFGGRVDIVIGSSMGGQIVQHLAADHPDCAGTFVMLAAACTSTERGKDLVRRQAAVVASGDRAKRGLAAAEEMLPGRRLGWLRRLLVPLAARMWDWQTGPDEHEYFEHDAAVEADAASGSTRERPCPASGSRCCSSTATGTATPPSHGRAHRAADPRLHPRLVPRQGPRRHLRQPPPRTSRPRLHQSAIGAHQHPVTTTGGLGARHRALICGPFRFELPHSATDALGTQSANPRARR